MQISLSNNSYNRHRLILYSSLRSFHRSPNLLSLSNDLAPTHRRNYKISIHTRDFAKFPLSSNVTRLIRKFRHVLRFTCKHVSILLGFTRLYVSLFAVIDEFSPCSRFSGSSIAFLSDLLALNSHVGTRIPNRTAHRWLQRAAFHEFARQLTSRHLFDTRAIKLVPLFSDPRYVDRVNDKSICAPYDRRSTPELSPRKRTEILNPVHWLLPVSSIALIDTYEKLRFEQDIQEHYRRPRNWLRRLWNKVFNGEIWFACRVSFKERVSSLAMDNFTKTAFTARSVRSENDHFRF